jgi:hypothetical protein
MYSTILDGWRWSNEASGASEARERLSKARALNARADRASFLNNRRESAPNPAKRTANSLAGGQEVGRALRLCGVR